MGSITLERLKEASVLKTFVELAELKLSSGLIEEHVFKVVLMKHCGLTRASALKVMELAKGNL